MQDCKSPGVAVTVWATLVNTHTDRHVQRAFEWLYMMSSANNWSQVVSVCVNWGGYMWFIFVYIWWPWQLPVGSLKIFDSIFEFADPENIAIHAIIVSISCTELKSAQFWLIFV